MTLRRVYIVEPNDTLANIASSRLAAAHRWEEIARAKRISHFDPLLIGRPLVMPEPVMQSFDYTPRRILAAAQPAQPMERRPATTVPAWSYHFLLADDKMNSFRVGLSARCCCRREALLTMPSSNGQLIPSIMASLYAIRPARCRWAGTSAGGWTAVSCLRASTQAGRRGSPASGSGSTSKAQAAGVTAHETQTIIADLDRVIARSKNAVQRANLTRIRELSLNVDREILLEGLVPAAAVKTGPMLAAARGMQVVSGVGVVLTAYDLERAAERSHATHSVRPLAAETVRQAGGWAGAWAGMQGGALIGGALGIETGPGALITGFIGGAIGGVAGFMGASWIASSIEQ